MRRVKRRKRNEYMLEEWRWSEIVERHKDNHSKHEVRHRLTPVDRAKSIELSRDFAGQYFVGHFWVRRKDDRRFKPCLVRHAQRRSPVRRADGCDEYIDGYTMAITADGRTFTLRHGDRLVPMNLTERRLYDRRADGFREGLVRRRSAFVAAHRRLDEQIRKVDEHLQAYDGR